MTDFTEILKLHAQSFDDYLENCLPKDTSFFQHTVIEAMRYSLLSGGKRLRPFLLNSFCKSCGGSERDSYPLAAALEMIHTYSLIHDDLPCMDNDSLRRGKLTNHMVFGEATALLAGDGLLNAAVETAVQNGLTAEVPTERILRSINVLYTASGWRGMLGGQMADLECTGKDISEEQLLRIHSMKTAALLKAACEIGCIVGGGAEDFISAAGEYGFKLGIAFQIVDDILDEIGDVKTLGKNTGSDNENHKTTYVTLLGISGAKEEAARYSMDAKYALKGYPDSQYYSDLLDFLLERGK